MAYKDDYGITEICNNRENGKLSISYEPDQIFEGELIPRHPILLYVPDVREFEHFHIKLTEAQAKRLRSWLDSYLVESVKSKEKRNV